MKKLQQLLRAARTMAPECEIKLRGTEKEDEWICLVTVGGAVLFESKPGPWDVVIEEAARKMKGVSQRMRAVLQDPDEEEPSSKKPA